MKHPHFFLIVTALALVTQAGAIENDPNRASLMGGRLSQAGDLFGGRASQMGTQNTDGLEFRPSQGGYVSTQTQSTSNDQTQVNTVRVSTTLQQRQSTAPLTTEISNPSSISNRQTLPQLQEITGNTVRPSVQQETRPSLLDQVVNQPLTEQVRNTINPTTTTNPSARQSVQDQNIQPPLSEQNTGGVSSPSQIRNSVQQSRISSLPGNSNNTPRQSTQGLTQQLTLNPSHEMTSPDIIQLALTRNSVQQDPLSSEQRPPAPSKKNSLQPETSQQDIQHNPEAGDPHNMSRGSDIVDQDIVEPVKAQRTTIFRPTIMNKPNPEATSTERNSLLEQNTTVPQATQQQRLSNQTFEQLSPKPVVVDLEMGIKEETGVRSGNDAGVKATNPVVEGIINDAQNNLNKIGITTEQQTTIVNTIEEQGKQFAEQHIVPKLPSWARPVFLWTSFAADVINSMVITHSFKKGWDPLSGFASSGLFVLSGAGKWVAYKMSQNSTTSPTTAGTQQTSAPTVDLELQNLSDKPVNTARSENLMTEGAEDAPLQGSILNILPTTTTAQKTDKEGCLTKLKKKISRSKTQKNKETL